MCTAATYHTKNFYSGRTLDYDFSYGEEITITPRNFPFHFRKERTLPTHYALIGMAHVTQNYPLYYDAMNEKGLYMAGLNFVGNADYKEYTEGKDNISPFEFIPWILGQCATMAEARKLLEQLNLIHLSFRKDLPLSQLHWLIAGKADTGECTAKGFPFESITVESMAGGLCIHDNPAGVLTNNPPFREQLFHLNNFMHLSPREPQNHFSVKLPLHAYSRGMGALGLPGDLSSQSRFVRAAFVRANSLSGDSEAESVNQFFHILGAVEQPRGCCALGEGKHEITLYTSCCSADQGIYYYTTYENHQITAVRLFQEDLNISRLIRYPLVRGEQIHFQNK